MALRTSRCKVKAGRLIPVYNLGRRKFSRERRFYSAVWVEDADGGNERCLLFTEGELKRAEERAARNPEDLPKKGWLEDLTD